MYKLGTLGFLGLLLSACGGGGGSGANDPSVTPLPTPAGEVTISLAKRNFDCPKRIPNTDATLVVHRQDGSVLATYQPDIEGNAILSWPSEARHLSLVNKNGDEWNIDSWLEVQTGDFGTWVSYDQDFDTGCSCKSLDFDVSAISSAYPSHQLSIRHINTAEEGAVVPLQVCFESDTDSAVVDLVLRPDVIGQDAYAATLTVSPDISRYALEPALFSGSEAAGEMLTISSNLSESFRYTTYSNTEHGRLFGQYYVDPLYAFPGLNDSNLVQGSVSRNYPTAEGDVTYLVIRRVKVEDPDQVQVIFSDNEQVLADRLIDTMVAFSEGISSQYDFSDIGTNRALFFIDTYATNLNWSIDGPLAGTLPDLSLPETMEAEIEAANPEIQNVILGTSGYMQGGGLQEFRRQRRMELQSGSQKRPAYFDNFDMEYLSINPN